MHGRPRMGTIARHGGLVGAQVYRGPRDANLPTRPFRFPCHSVHVHHLTVLGDGPCVVRMARPGRSTGAPCPLWAPRRPSFNPVVSLYTIKPWTRHNCGAKIWHLPHNELVTQWNPSQFTQWRSKPVHTMEIQADSHTGDPSRFTQRRPKAGSHNGDPKPVHTMEIPISSQEFCGNPFHITWPLSSFELHLQQKAYV